MANLDKARTTAKSLRYWYSPGRGFDGAPVETLRNGGLNLANAFLGLEDEVERLQQDAAAVEPLRICCDFLTQACDAYAVQTERLLDEVQRLRSLLVDQWTDS